MTYKTEQWFKTHYETEMGYITNKFKRLDKEDVLEIYTEKVKKETAAADAAAAAADAADAETAAAVKAAVEAAEEHANAAAKVALREAAAKAVAAREAAEQIIKLKTFDALSALRTIQKLLETPGNPDFVEEIKNILRQAESGESLKENVGLLKSKNEDLIKSTEDKFKEEFDVLKKLKCRHVERVLLDRPKLVNGLIPKILQVVRKFDYIEDVKLKNEHLSAFDRSFEYLSTNLKDVKTTETENYDLSDEQFEKSILILLNEFEENIYKVQHKSNWGVSTHFGATPKHYLYHKERSNRNQYTVNMGKVKLHLGSTKHSNNTQKQTYTGGKSRRKRKRTLSKRFGRKKF